MINILSVVEAGLEPAKNLYFVYITPYPVTGWRIELRYARLPISPLHRFAVFPAVSLGHC